MTLILEHHFYLLMPKTLYILRFTYIYTRNSFVHYCIRNENGFVAIHCFELNRGYWRVAVLVHLSHSALLRIQWQPDERIYLVLECRSNREYSSRVRDRTPTRRKLNIILSFNQIISFLKIICGILDKVLLFHSIYRTYFSKYHIKTNVTQTSAFVPYLYIPICVYSTGRMKRTFRILYYYFSGYNPNKLIGDKQNNQLSFRTMLLLWQPWRCEYPNNVNACFCSRVIVCAG